MNFQINNSNESEISRLVAEIDVVPKRCRGDWERARKIYDRVNHLFVSYFFLTKKKEMANVKQNIDFRRLIFRWSMIE